jgi:hypothetical protein
MSVCFRGMRVKEILGAVVSSRCKCMRAMFLISFSPLSPTHTRPSIHTQPSQVLSEDLAAKQGALNSMAVQLADQRRSHEAACLERDRLQRQVAEMAEGVQGQVSLARKGRLAHTHVCMHTEENSLTLMHSTHTTLARSLAGRLPDRRSLAPQGPGARGIDKGGEGGAAEAGGRGSASSGEREERREGVRGWRKERAGHALLTLILS